MTSPNNRHSQQNELCDYTSELIEGQVVALTDDPARSRMLHLIQNQLVRALSTVASEKDTKRFEVRIRPALQINEFNELKPALALYSPSSALTQSVPTWILDVEESSSPAGEDSSNKASDRFSPQVLRQHRTHQYARFAVSDYWSLDLNMVELHLYQQPTESGYQQHRVLQVGDQASPSNAPVIIKLQEPLPLYFMTRTLKGQQIYESRALPFSIKPCRSLAY